MMEHGAIILHLVRCLTTLPRFTMSSPTPSRMLSRDVVAKLLGISRQTVDRLIRSGELRAIKIGRRVLIPDDALDALIALKYAWKQCRSS